MYLPLKLEENDKCYNTYESVHLHTYEHSNRLSDVHLSIYIYMYKSLNETAKSILKLKSGTHGLNQHLDFLTPYRYFHK